MAVLALKVLDKDGKTICVGSDEDYVGLVCTAEYKEGDRIVLETSGQCQFIWIQLDDALGAAFCYVTGNFSFEVPFGEKRTGYSPKAFLGARHYLTARIAREDEITACRNLCVNIYDNHQNTTCFPHAHANIETRGEAVFAARNAIDGICENRSHGEWPYESWGINQREDAELTVEFGREVTADRIVLYTRADFPHDSWWKQVTLVFSDGTSLDWELEKSVLPHVLTIETKKITWIRLCKLIKADDASVFPALSQIEVYGVYGG